MEHLTALADKHGVTLEGIAKPVGKGGLSKKPLVEFYRNFGFTVNAQSGDMSRPPKKNLSDWSEDLHPRAEDGRFAGSDGGSRQSPEDTASALGRYGFPRQGKMINDNLYREKLDDLPSYIRDTVTALDRAMEPGRDQLTTFRVVEGQHASGWKVGDTVTSPAFVSTSTNKDFIENTRRQMTDWSPDGAAPYVVEMVVPKGAPQIDTEKFAHLKKNDYEWTAPGEVILPRGTKMRIEKINGRNVTVTVVRSDRTDLSDFDEDLHPRDENGKFTTSGGSDSVGVHVDGDVIGGPIRVKSIVPIVVDVAKSLDFPDHRIVIVDKKPREFKVGNALFSEGGHYNPATGAIEINVRGITRGASDQSFAGLAAHEIAHAQFDVVMKAMEKEHDDLRDMATNPDRKDEYGAYFRPRSGAMRPEREAALMAKYPASAAFVRTWGDAYLIPNRESSNSMDELIREDGVTEYSRAYWGRTTGSSDLFVYQHPVDTKKAINETLSEVARYDYQARRGIKWDGKAPSQKWQQFSRDIRETYKKLVKRDA